MYSNEKTPTDSAPALGALAGSAGWFRPEGAGPREREFFLFLVEIFLER